MELKLNNDYTTLNDNYTNISTVSNIINCTIKNGSGEIMYLTYGKIVFVSGRVYPNGATLTNALPPAKYDGYIHFCCAGTNGSQGFGSLITTGNNTSVLFSLSNAGEGLQARFNFTYLMK